MSIVKSSVVNNATAMASDSGEPMLTPEQFIEQVRALRQRIPEWASLPKNVNIKQYRRIAGVNPEFTREAISAVGDSKVVQAVIGNTAEDLVLAEDEMTRWSLAESEVRALLHGLTAANLVRRQRLGRAALEVFSVSRQLAGRDEHAHLASRVEQMKRLPKYRRGRTVHRTAAAEPTQPPVAKV